MLVKAIPYFNDCAQSVRDPKVPGNLSRIRPKILRKPQAHLGHRRCASRPQPPAAGFGDCYLKIQRKFLYCQQALGQLKIADPQAAEQIEELLAFALTHRGPYFEPSASTLSDQQNQKLAAGTLAAAYQLDLRASNRRAYLLKMVHQNTEDIQERELEAAREAQNGGKASRIRRIQKKVDSLREDLLEYTTELETLQDD